MAGPGISLQAMLAVCKSHQVEFAIVEGRLSVRGDPAKMPAEFRALVKMRLPEIEAHLRGVPLPAAAAPTSTPQEEGPREGTGPAGNAGRSDGAGATPPVAEAPPPSRAPSPAPAGLFPPADGGVGVCSREECRAFGTHRAHTPLVSQLGRALDEANIKAPAWLQTLSTATPYAWPPVEPTAPATAVAEKPVARLVRVVITRAENVSSDPGGAQPIPVAQCFKCRLEVLYIDPEGDPSPRYCLKCGGPLMGPGAVAHAEAPRP